MTRSRIVVTARRWYPKSQVVSTAFLETDELRVAKEMAVRDVYTRNRPKGDETGKG